MQQKTLQSNGEREREMREKKKNGNLGLEVQQYLEGRK